MLSITWAPAPLFSTSVMEALHIACDAMGAKAYLDWFEVENTVGSQKVQDEFSRRLLDALSA
jgi:hypothetical protein